jgi:hypothetical protein
MPRTGTPAWPAATCVSRALDVRVHCPLPPSLVLVSSPRGRAAWGCVWILAKPAESCSVVAVLEVAPLAPEVAAHDVRVLELGASIVIGARMPTSSHRVGASVCALELTVPQGRSTMAAVPLVLSGVLMSPDCNWTLALNATGTRLPVVRRKATHLAAIVILVRVLVYVCMYVCVSKLTHTPMYLPWHAPHR